MKWGRLWGKMRSEKGFERYSYWGAEEDELINPRQTIRITRGRIVPCDSCKRIYNCAMYKSFTRHRMRGEYAHGTNILHMCDIYANNRIPGSIKAPQIHGRTSGKEPT